MVPNDSAGDKWTTAGKLTGNASAGSCQFQLFVAGNAAFALVFNGRTKSCGTWINVHQGNTGFVSVPTGKAKIVNVGTTAPPECEVGHTF
jgi:hypothetical protein